MQVGSSDTRVTCSPGDQQGARLASVWRRMSSNRGTGVARLLSRLRRTDAEEIRFRCAEGTRVAGEALRFACSRERWQRARLQSRLLASSTDLASAHQAMARRDWSGANLAIQSHFLRRPARFVIDPAARGSVSHAVDRLCPTACEEAIRRADQLRAGRYDLLGYRGLSYHGDTDPIDWHVDPVHERRAPLRFWARIPYLDPRLGDHKIIWELNRHQHWLSLGRAAWLTGDARYAASIGAELDSWMLSNPPLTGINWSSMLEVALRSISWIWTLHFLAAVEPPNGSASFVDLLLGLERQLDHVARHLSFYFSPNTHLLGEGLALYVGGRVLPELRRASAWEQIGRDVLISQAHAQVLADGGHAERSTHYHRYTLDFYLLALAVARRTNDPAAGEFAKTTSQLASFCRTLADDNGRLATIGDDDGGLLFPICGRAPADASDSLWVAAALLKRPELAVGDAPEEALWLLGPEAMADVPALRQPRPTSHLYPDTGFGVLRDADCHAVLDAGPHGFLNGGHAHAGALSLVLSVRGRPLLIDPGTATYTADATLRDRFRSTVMHNTLVIDGRSQSVPAGPFHWESRANAHVVLWRPGLRGSSTGHGATPGVASIDYIEAEHDGYLPLVHRRAVLRVPNGLWIIADHVLGAGRHTLDAYWHLAPAWTLEPAGRPGTSYAHPDGLWASFATTGRHQREFRGDPEGLGWCAPVYGQLVPAPTLRVSDTVDAPTSLVTVIVGGESPARLSIESARVVVEDEDRWHRAAVKVRWGGNCLLVLFATPASGDDGRGERRSLQRLPLANGEFITDARVALLSILPEGEPVPLALVDSSEAVWTGRSGLPTAPPSGLPWEDGRQTAAVLGGRDGHLGQG